MQNSQQGSSEKREQLSALHRSLSQKQERTLFSVAEIRHLSDAACRNVSNSPDRLAMLARRSGAALKLVHVVEPYSLYQRLSHTLTEPYSQEELAQKAGQQLEACADSLMRETQKNALSVEYEVRAGKPFVFLGPYPFCHFFQQAFFTPDVDMAVFKKFMKSRLEHGQ